MSIESSAAKRLNILAGAAVRTERLNKEAFKKAYNESRNGANSLTELVIKFNETETAPLRGKFLISDGVNECAKAGADYFIAGMALEMQLLTLPMMVKKPEPDHWTCIVVVKAEDGCGVVEFQFEDGLSALTVELAQTEFPDGTWNFYLTNDGEPDVTICILITEY
jgi:hypothetical protein